MHKTHENTNKKFKHEYIYLSKDYELDRPAETTDKDRPTHTYMLINHKKGKMLTITKEEAFLWLTLSRNPSVKSAIFNFATSYEAFNPQLIIDILENWLKLGLAQIKYQRKVNVKISRLKLILSVNIKIELFAKLFRTLFKITKPLWGLNTYVILISTAVGLNIVGLWALSTGIINYQFHYSRISTLSILGIALISLFFHELGHAFALQRFGLKNFSTGIKIEYGIPFFYVDTTLSWVRRRFERVIISSAGILANLIISGFGFLLIIFSSNFSNTNFALIHVLIFINLVNVFINLVPVLKLDGYYIMIDLFGLPFLHEKLSNQIKTLFTKGSFVLKLTATIYTAIYILFGMGLLILFYSNLL
jgi:putative peptide zinc metalloprotease protein